MPWQKLDAESDIDSAIQLSFQEPVLLFKHSYRCSISAAALGRLERSLDDWSPLCVAYLVDVVGQRPISNALALRLGISHESPQILLLSNGSCVYHTSHFGIQAAELLAALNGLKSAH